ncbi:autotransporter outer membrane beta-barrel domain-containing protein [Reyranella sp.]|uniref:autotransporter outer membrane beta-barrel domain-containing protein n=1 Tax=Reyranella sp. TaxID=1929291 RepID=UPI003D0CA8F2
MRTQRRFLPGRLRRQLVSLLVVGAIATGGTVVPRPAAAFDFNEAPLALVVIFAISIGGIDRFHPFGMQDRTASLSCPVFIGSGTLLGEDDCAWVKATGQWTSQSGSSGSSAVVRIGGQKEIAPGWFLGGSFGAGSQWLQDGNGYLGNGQLFDGSVALKRTVGPWLFAGAIAFSSASLHVAPIGLGLAGDSNIYNGGMRLRGAYDVDFTGWYVRPRLDLDLVHSWQPGFQLTGPGPAGFGLAGISVDGTSKTSFAATPMVELGARFDTEQKLVIRPYAAVGASFLPDNNTTVTASFTGPLAGLGRLQSTSSGPSVLANVEAGLQLYKAGGFEAKADYRLSAGDGFISQGASLRGAYHF